MVESALDEEFVKGTGNGVESGIPILSNRPLHRNQNNNNNELRK